MKRGLKIILEILLVSSLFLLTEGSMAQDLSIEDGLIPVIVSAEDEVDQSSAEIIEEELYEQIKLLQILEKDPNGRVSNVVIDGIEPRDTLTELRHISGSADEANTRIWFFLVNDQKNAMYLGDSSTNFNKKFDFDIPEIPAQFRGEIFLIASQAPDLRLAPLLKKKTLILALYLYQEESIPKEKRVSSPSISIQSLEFYEGDIKVTTLISDYLRVYKPGSGPLKIKIKGNVYGDGLDELVLSSSVSPGISESVHIYDTSAEPHFDIEISGSNLALDTELKLELSLKKNLPDGELGQAVRQSTTSFIIKDASDFPDPASILWESTGQNNNILIYLLGFVLTILMINIVYQKLGPLKRLFCIILIVAELGLISLMLANVVLNKYFDAGLIKVPGEELIVQKKSFVENNALTLTKLNEDLLLVPALASSWSNISPKIWEFIIRQDSEAEAGQKISAQDIIQSLKEKISSDSPEKQFLSSVKQIISINENRLQFITRFVDPLLAQKLTKVNLNSIRSSKGGSRSTELFIPVEQFSDHVRFVRNDNYFNLPFLENTSVYKSEIFDSNTDRLKNIIKTRGVDIFDEPEVILWFDLSQNDYRIVPKINTGSLMLLTNRNSFYLKNEKLLRALRIILQSPRILQTSYFQYGQLANQFAPPGVIGHFPDIEIPKDSQTYQELLDQAKADFGDKGINLKLHYPSQENIVAQVIEQELEKEGINIIPVMIPGADYENALLENLPDLILIPLDFDLADVAPFLDALVDSKSRFNSYYKNAQVDDLIRKSRTELNSFRRLELIQEIMQIIVVEDPVGIPLLFKRSFVAKKMPVELGFIDRLLQKLVLGWK